ncbi:hypothetical protein D3C71_2175890 [compost metagenome]
MNVHIDKSWCNELPSSINNLRVCGFCDVFAVRLGNTFNDSVPCNNGFELKLAFCTKNIGIFND